MPKLRNVFKTQQLFLILLTWLRDQFKGLGGQTLAFCLK